MTNFNSIKAFGLKVGDVVPTPLQSGGWDKKNPIAITSINRDADMLVFQLERGKMFRSFPMNTIPFKSVGA